MTPWKKLLGGAAVTAAVTAAAVTLPPKPPLQKINYTEPTRVYLMRGLGELSPFGDLMDAIRAKKALVFDWSWLSHEAVVADVLAHPKARIVVAGHSMGDLEAFTASAEIAAAGRKDIITIGLDPLCTWPQATKGLEQYNILGNTCGGVLHKVPGAHNVVLTGPGHIEYPADSRVIRLFIKYAFPTEQENGNGSQAIRESTSERPSRR